MTESLPLERMDDNVVGLYRDYPTLVTFFYEDPLGFFFKLRVDTDEDVEIVLNEGLLKELIDEKIATVKVEGQHGWITFNDLVDFDPSILNQCLDEFIDAMIDHEILATQGCAYCDSTEPAKILYHKGQVNKACDECIEKRRISHVQQDDKANCVKRSLIFTIAPLYIAFACVWALVWIFWDQLFVIMGVTTIWMPDYVIFAVVVGVGFSLGAPMGILARKSGLARLFSPAVTCIIFVLPVILFGEIIYFNVIVYMDYGIFLFDYSLDIFKDLSLMYNTTVMVMKLGIAITMIVTNYIFAKRKEIRVEL